MSSTPPPTPSSPSSPGAPGAAPAAPAYPRRSPMADAWSAARPTLVTRHGMPVPDAFPDERPGTCSRLGLVDLSCIPCVGLKGRASAAAIQAITGRIPDADYGVLPWPSPDRTGRIIRVDMSEHLLIADLDDTSLTDQAAAIPFGEGVVPVLRQDAVLGLCGSGALAVLAETCAVDFRQERARIVYSRVAGVSCLIIPEESGGIRWFRLLFAASFGVYMWDTLSTIVTEHHGRPNGLAAWHDFSHPA